MSATRSIVLIGLVALSSCGRACSRDGSGTAGTSSPAAASTALGESDGFGKLTSPKIELPSLERQIKNAEKRFDGAPESLTSRSKLIDLLLRRSSLLGKVSDLDRVDDLGDEAVDLAPEDGQAYFLRGRARAALHRFDEALADFDEAEKRGVKPDKLEGPRLLTWEALGRFDEALAGAQKNSDKHKTPHALTGEAILLGRTGKLQEAESKFDEAIAAGKTIISPFFVSNYWFERGQMWERAGDNDKAIAYYKKAVARLPQHAHATGHLAELLPPAEAEKLLAEIIKTSDDPEYLGALGAAKNALTAGSGDELIAKAKTGYDELMKKHPQAFADHAGWFWLDIGKDPQKALAAARTNLAVRKTTEAYELLVAALVAAGEKDEACKSADEGLALKYPSHGLEHAAADAFEACGKGDRAAELKKKHGGHAHTGHAH